MNGSYGIQNKKAAKSTRGLLGRVVLLAVITST